MRQLTRQRIGSRGTLFTCNFDEEFETCVYLIEGKKIRLFDRYP